MHVAGTPTPIPLRRILTSLIAGAVGIALVATLDLQPSAAAPKDAGDKPWQAQQEKSVPGVNAKVTPRKPDPAAAAALTSAPSVRWPSPGTAEVAVPEPAAAAGGWTARPKERAGNLPVWIGAGKSATTAQSPGRARVQVLGRRGDALLLRIGRGDGQAGTAQLSARVDYSAFRHAYGGDWALRLGLVKLPECALRTPEAAGCAATPLPTLNRGDGQLTAELTTSSGADLFAVQAASSSSAGTYQASDLAPSATWQAGGSSGDLTWSYPMATPPSIGGPDIDLELAYSSGSVDGRTSSTNSQPSWAGEGFDLTPGGSIERRYKACANDLNGNNGTRKTGDLCWGTDNATFSLNGKGGELVRDDATGQWRMRADDGSKVERLTGAANGDNNGEYWRITSPDGTQYYFGRHRLPGWVSGNTTTNSVFTVPVYGNHSGEPCHTSSFASSYCSQAYRWNLDYVADRHGNTMSLYYVREYNKYARNQTSTTLSSYHRAGHIRRIEYGQADGAVYTTAPVARVWFNTAERCVPGSACTTSQPATYPDTPLDQTCSGTTCTKYSPSFWTQKRLASVTTEVRSGTSFTPVSTWTFRHLFPDPGDGTRAGLWLEGITETGSVGGAVAVPEINFDGVQRANRLDAYGDGIPPMNWWRVSAVHEGNGGELAITYSGPECTATTLPAPDSNGKRCHPQKWTTDAGSERTDWFHKYVVTQVSENDRVGGGEPATTSYQYLGPAAWHFDEEDGLVDTKYKSWSQWRGYQNVRETKGSTSGPRSVTEHTYFRGMHGDRTASGGTKSVSVTDSTGGTAVDSDALTGEQREEITYNSGVMVDRTITGYWVSGARATRVKSWGTTRAYQVEESDAAQAETVTGGGVRAMKSTNTYSAAGIMLTSEDLGDTATSADDTCARYEYLSNAGAGISEVPARAQVVSKGCGATWTNADVIADERAYYDGATTYGTAPTRGDVTKAERLKGFSSTGQPLYQTLFTATYDAVGRRTSYTDALGRRTSRGYTPSGRDPLTKVLDTHPNGHVETSLINPAWGSRIADIDAAGRRTDIARDPMGRVSKVWLPGRTKDVDTPHFEYGYLVRVDGPSVVTTKSLQANGTIETSYQLLDGLDRVRQSQEPAPGGGRIVTDYVYDSRGLEVKENGPYYNDAPPGTDVLVPDETQLPTQKLILYDGAERPTAEVFRSYGQEQWRTGHAYGGGVHTLDPPTGEAPSTRFTDVRGRQTELREYTTASPSNSYDTTTYRYDAAGQLTEVSDPVGNTWRFGYDLRGRKIREEDPDAGVSTYTYDDADQLVTSTDARGVTLAHTYDSLGRKTSVRQGSTTGPVLAAWTYDTVSPGLPASATRYVDGNAYTQRVTGYDPGGRPTGMEIVIPASEGALAGTYRFGTTYRGDGEVATQTLPGVGGLPAETLTFGYNDQDLPTTLTGATTYAVGTSYTALGEPALVTLRPTGGKWVQRGYTYDTATRRLTNVVTNREVSPRRISSRGYEYDDSSNVTKITDAPSSLSGEPTDTECFDYDHHRRLTQAWTPGNGDCTAAPTAAGLGGPAPYWQSWTFDKTGNRKTETRTSSTGATSTSSYSYPAAGGTQPHALQSVSNGATTNTYQYDAAGNLTGRTLNGVAESFAWNAEGGLQKVTKGAQSTEFLYDADGNRLIKRDSTGTTLSLGQTELKATSSGTLVGTRYYEHGGEMIAVRVGNHLTWVVPDHHGTPSIAIDADTQEVRRHRITPYGQTRGDGGEIPGQRGFVGGVNDASTGLVHLGAREYDPTTGRFISVDPIADYDDPQQINGYAYGNNNPITYTDPDGKLFWFAVIAIVRVAAPVVVRVATKQIAKRAVRSPKRVPVRVKPRVGKGRLGKLFGNFLRSFIRWITTWVTKIIKFVKTVWKTIKRIKWKKKQVVRWKKKESRKPSSRDKQKSKRAPKSTKRPPSAKPQQRPKYQKNPPIRVVRSKPDKWKDNLEKPPVHGGPKPPQPSQPKGGRPEDVFRDPNRIPMDKTRPEVRQPRSVQEEWERFRPYDPYEPGRQHGGKFGQLGRVIEDILCIFVC
ncbi:MAG: RHS repeat-associated core domain-containing protein [Micromonosporaceae bacterium]